MNQSQDSLVLMGTPHKFVERHSIIKIEINYVKRNSYLRQLDLEYTGGCIKLNERRAVNITG